MRILTDNKEIQAAHVEFANKLYGESSGFIKGLVGFQGGSQPAELVYSEEHKFWWVFDEVLNLEYSPKLWNVFGMGIPKDDKLHTIVCEINYDVDGYNPRLGGALAKDKRGHLHILHNGNIGGGRKGIGKDAFKTHYKNPTVSIPIGKSNEEFAIVCNLDSPQFMKEIKSFIKEVYYIKILVTKGAITSGRRL